MGWWQEWGVLVWFLTSVSVIPIMVILLASAEDKEEGRMSTLERRVDELEKPTESATGGE